MIAYRLETPRLRLRAYDPADADVLVQAVATSREHLRPYMDFAAAEPQLDDYVELLVDFRRKFTAGDYAFSIWTKDGTLVGGAGLHPSVGHRKLGREIGYWITRDAVGNGYAGEAVAALCSVAFHQEGVDRVELHIEPRNTASLRVGEKAGFTREGVLRRRIAYLDEEPRDAVILTLFASDYAASPVGVVPVRRYDAAGRLIVSSAAPEQPEHVEADG